MKLKSNYKGTDLTGYKSRKKSNTRKQRSNYKK